ncbi:MAG TPA: GerMN domain-containing protein, partial [Egibacteraceae bacterium]|nr:GerMN domain-containing protein [Egibacteraceae bacterium]
LELLIAGPAEGDPKDARPALPLSTTIAAFAVDGDTAVVELSQEAVSDAGTVIASPEHELLAMAAVANTLTEFPAIDHVRLSVSGAGREFWGGWGLPELLNRDEAVIGVPREGDPLPPLERFAVEAQRVGSAAAGAVAIGDVRTHDRIGFVRVTVELGDPGGEAPARGVPPTSARLEGDRLVLQIDDVVSSAANPAPGQRLALEGLPFDALEAEAGVLPGPARFALPTGPRPFWLHTLTSPTRVVLDVRK